MITALLLPTQYSLGLLGTLLAGQLDWLDGLVIGRDNEDYLRLFYVLRELRRRGMTTEDLRQLPIELALRLLFAAFGVGRGGVDQKCGQDPGQARQFQCDFGRFGVGQGFGAEWPFEWGGQIPRGVGYRAGQRQIKTFGSAN